MKQIFPFILETKENVVSSNVEKAIVTCLSHRRVFDQTIPRERQEGESLLAIAQVKWPVLLKRAFGEDRAFLFDLLNIMGEKIQLTASPERSLDLEDLKVNSGDSYRADLLHIAEAVAFAQGRELDSHVVAKVVGLPELLGKERSLKVEEWGTLLVETEQSAVQKEKELLEAWVDNFRREDLKVDQLIQIIRERSSERTEQLMKARDKSLLLMREEIDILKPQVDTQLSELNTRQQDLGVHTHELNMRLNALEEEIAHIQNEVERYKDAKSNMLAFFEAQLRDKREEYLRTDELRLSNQTGFHDELTAQEYLLRRPLQILQDQLKEAEAQWKARIQQQKSLEENLILTLQEEQLRIQASISEMFNLSFNIGVTMPDEIYLELPFVIAKAGTLYQHYYYVIAPGRLEKRGQLSGFFTNLMGRLNVPYASRGPAWDAMATGLERHLNQANSPARLLRIVEDNNLLDDQDYWMKALEGINELQELGQISLKEAENLKEAVVKNWGGRTY